MAILRELRYEWLSDADDYRPDSRLAFAVDPADGDGVVRSLGFIFEVVGPGDAGPLHRHPSDEAIFVEEGEVEIRIGDEVEVIGPEMVAFIPRYVPHAWRNIGTREIRLRAVFPTDVMAIETLERNPAPGTEADPPRPPWWMDLRAAIRQTVNGS